MSIVKITIGIILAYSIIMAGPLVEYAIFNSTPSDRIGTTVEHMGSWLYVFKGFFYIWTN